MQFLFLRFNVKEVNAQKPRFFHQEMVGCDGFFVYEPKINEHMQFKIDFGDENVSDIHEFYATRLQKIERINKKTIKFTTKNTDYVFRFEKEISDDLLRQCSDNAS